MDLPIQIEAVHLDRTLSVEPYLPYIPEEKADRLMRYHKQEDKLRGLAGELLIRSFIMRERNRPNSDIRFTQGAKGKPYWETEGVPFHFNISHSGDWVVGAFACADVGIDVEAHRPITDWEGILGRVASAAEMEAYRQLHNEDDRERLFYTIWTRKESFLKATGEGLSTDPRAYHVLEDHVADDWEGEWFIRSYELADDYSLAVCCRSGFFPDGIKRMELQELTGAFMNNPLCGRIERPRQPASNGTYKG